MVCCAYERWNILDQRPAERDIEHLMSSTNGKHWFSGRQEQLQQLELEVIPLSHRNLLGHERRLPIMGRVHVLSAGQEQTVNETHDFRDGIRVVRDGQEDWHSSGPSHVSHIVRTAV